MRVTVHCMSRGMESRIGMQADLEGTPDVNARVSFLASGRTSVSLSEMASVGWSQHRVSFSRYDRTAFENNLSS
jgi:hypothetical protein